MDSYIQIDVKLGDCPECCGQSWEVTVDGKKPEFRHRQKTDAVKWAEEKGRTLAGKDKKSAQLTVYDPKGRRSYDRYFEVDDSQMDLPDGEEESR